MAVRDLAESDRIFANVHFRIQEQIDHFGGTLPERHAIAWAGFLAALSEEGLLAQQHYASLMDMLPEISAPNPVRDLFVFEPNNPLLNV